MDWNDRGTCILFGDGAGAVVLSATEQGLFSSVTYSDGQKKEALTCDLGSVIKMNGQEIFKFAVKQVPACIHELLDKNHLNVSDITYFVLHQANRRIIEAAAKRLQVDLEHFPMNLQEYGNTSSASIPILLHEMVEKNMLKPGDKLILAGFGAGLTWGATLLEW